MHPSNLGLAAPAQRLRKIISDDDVEGFDKFVLNNPVLPLIGDSLHAIHLAANKGSDGILNRLLSSPFFPKAWAYMTDPNGGEERRCSL